MRSGVGMTAGVRAVVEAMMVQDIQAAVHRAKSLRPSQQQHEGHERPDGTASRTHGAEI
jgi:hypothetical protein